MFTVRQVEQDTGWQYDTDLAVASGTKVGGYPGWTQPPDWPVCPCGATMQHLLTVATWEFSRGDEKRWIPVEDRSAMAGWDFNSPGDHPWRTIQNPAGLMLGDAGGIYLFACTACPDRPFDYRFDCSRRETPKRRPPNKGHTISRMTPCAAAYYNSPSGNVRASISLTSVLMLSGRASHVSACTAASITIRRSATETG